MDVKSQVIQARNSGYTYNQITEEYGIAKSTARDWVNSYNDNFSGTAVDTTNFENAVGTPYINNNLQRVKPSKKDKLEIGEFLENLTPLHFSRTNISSAKSKLSNYALVCSDLHFPLQCNKSIDIFFKCVEELKPSTIIINGDSCDMLAVSKYPKDIKTGYSLLDERIQYQQFLSDLIEISNGAKIYETSANHSSDGIDGRWRRYLSERIPELSCLPEVIDVLSYENIFLGDFKNRIEMVDYVDLNGLIVLHGDIVRANGGASALGMIQKLKSSVMMGHVHRLASTAVRVPAIANRDEAQWVAYEIGCMCDLNPLYCNSPNWQNGFAIVCLGDDNTFGVELVNIIDGKASISTLGKTITAG